MMPEGTSSAAFRLVWDEMEGHRRSFWLSATRVVVGRDEGADLMLPCGEISRRHAAVHCRGREFILEDLGSKNGTRLNGEVVERSPLVPGDEIGLGPMSLFFEEAHASDQTLAIVVGSRQRSERFAEGTGGEGSTTFLGGVGTRPEEDDLFEALLETGSPASTRALSLAASRLGSTGACLIEAGSDGPTVLGIHGPLEDVPLAMLEDCLAGGREEGVDGGNIRHVCVSAGDEDWCGVVSPAGSLGLYFAPAGVLAGRERLLEALLRLADLGRRRPAVPAGRSANSRLVCPEDYVLGTSAASRRLHEALSSLVNVDLPVLLVGPTGSGKDAVARILHASSRRGEAPFVAVNCAAIPADLLEAELFGIEDRVATGVSARLGLFRRAHGGTLFLDEIGDMPPALQAKLLRVLDSGTVCPLGGQPIPVDVRILTATHVDLAERMERGEFRRDLFFRIAGCDLEIPPLRDRREDIPSMIEHLIGHARRATGSSLRGVSERALRCLVEYPWPGNIRELRHEIRRLVHQCPQGAVVESGHLAAKILSPGVHLEPTSQLADLDLEAQVTRLERRLILEALKRAGGNRSKAARLLSISRNGLAYRLRRLGLEDLSETRVAG